MLVFNHKCSVRELSFGLPLKNSKRLYLLFWTVYPSNIRVIYASIHVPGETNWDCLCCYLGTLSVKYYNILKYLTLSYGHVKIYNKSQWKLVLWFCVYQMVPCVIMLILCKSSLDINSKIKEWRAFWILNFKNFKSNLLIQNVHTFIIKNMRKWGNEKKLWSQNEVSVKIISWSLVNNIHVSLLCEAQPYFDIKL